MSRFSNILPSILTLGIFLAPISGQAHEYWIQPETYRLEQAENLVADIRVGMDFGGSRQPYITKNFVSFTLADSSSEYVVEGRLGDMPAVDISTHSEGLQILSLFTASSALTWDNYQEFDEFVNLHGMNWVLARHAERGLPETGFKEAYTRFVKSLTAVGTGAGQDRYTGMYFELVAGKNPYTDDISGGMPITVLFEGQPMADKQVDLFYRDTSGALTRLSVQSGAEGTAVVPNLGDGEYMVNVVHMVEPNAEDIERTEVVWHSLWGSITYAIGV